MLRYLDAWEFGLFLFLFLLLFRFGTVLFHEALFLLERHILGEELLQQKCEDGLRGGLDRFKGVLGFYLLKRGL